MMSAKYGLLLASSIRINEICNLVIGSFMSAYYDTYFIIDVMHIINKVIIKGLNHYF